MRALAGQSQLSNIDAFRHAIERLDPVTYLTAGYWGRWLGALETLVREDDPRVRPGKGWTTLRDPVAPPRFAEGSLVRVRDLRRNGHTRLPGYARSRHGVVVGHRGTWVYPDSNAHGQGEDPKHVYGVAFDGQELWGDTAEPGTRIVLDLFEPYLEPDPAAPARSAQAARKGGNDGGLE